MHNPLRYQEHLRLERSPSTRGVGRPAEWASPRARQDLRASTGALGRIVHPVPARPHPATAIWAGCHLRRRGLSASKVGEVRIRAEQTPFYHGHSVSIGMRVGAPWLAGGVFAGVPLLGTSSGVLRAQPYPSGVRGLRTCRLLTAVAQGWCARPSVGPPPRGRPSGPCWRRAWLTHTSSW
jgi:hypothetical protein